MRNGIARFSGAVNRGQFQTDPLPKLAVQAREITNRAHDALNTQAIS